MKLNEDKIDEMTLALMYLGLHDHDRAWKGFDWDSLNRLYQKNLIDNPAGKAKSVFILPEGMKLAEKLFEKHFLLPDESIKST